MTPKFVAFKGVYEKSYKIYQFDNDNWYVSDDGKGFPVDDTVKYKARFLKAETLEGINEAVRVAAYKDKYGKGDEGDAKCPNCGYWHSFNCYGYDTGLNEGFNERRECLCGKKFEFKIKVEIKWDISPI